MGFSKTYQKTSYQALVGDISITGFSDLVSPWVKRIIVLLQIPLKPPQHMLQPGDAPVGAAAATDAV